MSKRLFKCGSAFFLSLLFLFICKNFKSHCKQYIHDGRVDIYKKKENKYNLNENLTFEDVTHKK